MPDVVTILRKLVSFDTISHHGNLDMVRHVQSFLIDHGFATLAVPGSNSGKASLIARIGPETGGGVLFSGHMDTVSAEGWEDRALTLREENGRLYGLGATDMKGFLACVLSQAPCWNVASLTKPVWLVFSCDEETTQDGIRRALPVLKELGAKPDVCLIGEPTNNQVVTGHLSVTHLQLTCTGTSGHLSLPVSRDTTCAVMLAAQLLTKLDTREVRNIIGKRLGDPDLALPAQYGVASAGTARPVNRLPLAMDVRLMLRGRIDVSKREVQDVFEGYAAQILASVRKGHAHEAVEATKIIIHVDEPKPGYVCHDQKAIALAERFADSPNIGGVSFRVEAPYFAEAGFKNVVVLGPGDLYADHAHRPDESISIQALRDCQAVLKNAYQYCCE